VHVVVDSWAWFDNDDLPLDKRRLLQRKLTLMPRATHPKSEPQPIPLYVQGEKRFGVPRSYFLQNARLSHEVDYLVTDGADLPYPIEFNGALRPSQQEAFDVVVPLLKGGTLGGIVKAPTGWGKTVFACSLIAAMGVPTLVLVNKDPLVDQWLKAFKMFLPEAQVGLIQGERCDFQGKHVVVAMMQSLISRRDRYSPLLWAWPGMLIPDEVHRVAAPTWSQIPPLFPARWRIGLSATPRRKDGTDNVFLYHIGPMIYAATQMQLKPLIKRVWTKFRIAKSARFNPDLESEALLLKFMLNNRARNQLIIKKLIEALRTGRKVLVLSKRRNHLEILNEELRMTWSPSDGAQPTTSFCVGGVRGKALDEAKKARVLFATSQYVAEGFDVPALDTLFLTMPMADVEQAVGRILRLHKTKKDPIVVDFRDDEVALFKRWGLTRERLYARLTA
jgi:superfamily II DNA or RNA helicase